MLFKRSFVLIYYKSIILLNSTFLLYGFVSNCLLESLIVPVFLQKCKSIVDKSKIVGLTFTSINSQGKTNGRYFYLTTNFKYILIVKFENIVRILNNLPLAFLCIFLLLLYCELTCLTNEFLFLFTIQKTRHFYSCQTCHLLLSIITPIS